MNRLGTRTVTVVNRVPRLDAQGQPVRDRLNAPIVDDVPVPVTGCNVQPVSTTEVDDRGQQVIGDLVLFAPLGSPIGGATSAVIPYADEPQRRYEVIGDPERWEPSTRHSSGHLRVQLRKVTG